eukprot:GHVH01016899.1.p1 GENE.GHVH01016899.1~~GHVH01016899.1.p1  ORF type:complete len:489 (+),score=74.80 GHVH01016899.1:370-1836(+)
MDPFADIFTKTDTQGAHVKSSENELPSGDRQPSESSGRPTGRRRFDLRDSVFDHLKSLPHVELLCTVNEVQSKVNEWTRHSPVAPSRPDIIRFLSNTAREPPPLVLVIRAITDDGYLLGKKRAKLSGVAILANVFQERINTWEMFPILIDLGSKELKGCLIELLGPVLGTSKCFIPKGPVVVPDLKTMMCSLLITSGNASPWTRFVHGSSVPLWGLWDTCMLEWLIHPHVPDPDIASIIAKYDHQHPKETLFSPSPTNLTGKWVDFAKIAQCTERILIESAASRAMLLSYHQKYDIRLCKIFALLEANGISFFSKHVTRIDRELRRDAEESERAIISCSNNKQMNAASAQQVAVLLYDQLGLKIPEEVAHYQSRMKTAQRPTSDDVLALLGLEHPVVNKIRLYRQSTKMIATYVTSLLNETHWDQSSEQHRLHPQWNLTCTATGRLSANGPAIQQIPNEVTCLRGSSTGKSINFRRAFVPSKVTRVDI